MQTYDCKVKLADDNNNIVPKSDVTAAEIIILKTIHGAGAVLDVKERRMDKRKHEEERDRLLQTYGVRVNRIFPNELPVTLEDFKGRIAPPADLDEPASFGGAAPSDTKE